MTQVSCSTVTLLLKHEICTWCNDIPYPILATFIHFYSECYVGIADVRVVRLQHYPRNGCFNGSYNIIMFVLSLVMIYLQELLSKKEATGSARVRTVV